MVDKISINYFRSVFFFICCFDMKLLSMEKTSFLFIYISGELRVGLSNNLKTRKK